MKGKQMKKILPFICAASLLIAMPVHADSLIVEDDAQNIIVSEMSSDFSDSEGIIEIDEIGNNSADLYTGEIRDDEAIVITDLGTIESARAAAQYSSYGQDEEDDVDVAEAEEEEWLIGPNSGDQIALSNSSNKIMVNTTLQCQTTIEDAIWTSSDDSIATVDSNGLVTTKNKGWVSIFATSKANPQRSAQILINVLVPPSKITFDKTSIVMEQFESTDLLTTFTPIDAVGEITWESSNPKVATIDQTGRIESQANGTTTITARVGSVSATCKVTVRFVPQFVSITANNQGDIVKMTGLTKEGFIEADMNAGTVAKLGAVVFPDDAVNKNITWKSNNESVVKVDSTGKITAIKPGKATVTVRTIEGNNVYEDIIITVKSIPVNQITLNKTSAALNINNTMQLAATVTPSNATNKGITWSSSNNSVATVSASGLVTAKGAGTATITVKATDGSNKTATCKVTVSVPVTGISMSKNYVTIGAGDKVQLTATISPSNATDKAVTWASSNTNIATVTQSGYVTIKAPGNVIITATSRNGGKRAQCSINVLKPSVSYRLHQQTYGWQPWQIDGGISGRTGEAKRAEAIQIKLDSLTLPYSGSIQYNAHVQGVGWQGWKNSGTTAGTIGLAKRMEAIQIRLTGALASHYDIYYSTHVQTYGWLGWAKNGASSGTQGLAKRMEAIRIAIVPKGAAAPGSTANAFRTN